MSADKVAISTRSGIEKSGQWSLKDRRTVRYAVGATVSMAVALGFGWELSFIVPVLVLTFLSSPEKPLSIKSGLAFILIVGIACFVGWQLGDHGIPYLAVYIPLAALILFRIFYAGQLGRPFALIMMLLIAIMLIPLVRLIQPAIALFVAKGIFFDAVIAVTIGVGAFALIPEPQILGSGQPKSPAARVDRNEAFRNALISTGVVLPLLMLFYFFELTGAVVILVFVGLLASQPALAANFRIGKALIAGNILGGAITIVFYELLVMVPTFYFMLGLTLFLGLALGSQVFSEKPAARLFGMAYSTTLLIIGSTTTSTGDAGSEVYSRVLQITIAVVYVVTAFGLLNRLFPREE